MHIPVLPDAVLEYLDPRPDGTFIDATVGAGGHASAILDRTAPGGRLLAIDRDLEAKAAASRALERFGSRVVLAHASFGEIARIAAARGFSQVDGILADLGVSSMMLDRPERGFSFQSEGPLDMRMDRSQDLTAADIVNRTSERELADILFNYGEERRSRPIARSIVRRRPLHTTGDLVRAIDAVTPKRRHHRIHPATRTFMALRLVVNGELENLESFMEQAPGLLRIGGRLVVISFHSLEDRIVKHRMRQLGRVLTKKVIRAGETECRRNPRARSARLRALEKV